MVPTAKLNIAQLIAKGTQDQRPEFEQTVAGGFVNGLNFTTPTPLKTDRKIKKYYVKVRGRITVGAAPVAFRAGPAIFTFTGGGPTPLFSLIQQISITGQHNTFGAQTPIVMRGETLAELAALHQPNYVPHWAVSVNGGALVRGAALSGAIGATNDFEFVIPIPTYPMGSAELDQIQYCLHGPDWAGNLNMNIVLADPTALGVTIASLANAGVVTAFGAATGTASVSIYSVRPLLGKDLMARIQPAITFRLFDAQQITGVLSVGAVAADQKIKDLTVGRDTTRIYTKVGTQLAGTTAGVVVFGTLNDTFITRTLPKLDDRAISFGDGNSDLCLQDYMGEMWQRVIPNGYKCIDFVTGTGPGAPNLKAAFPSSNLTAARKFQLNADIITVGATEIGEVIQEMTLGQPQIG